MQSYLQNKRLGVLVESYLQQAQEEVDRRQVTPGLEKGEQARSDAKVPAASIQTPVDNNQRTPGQKSLPISSSLVRELRGVVEQTRSLADGSTEQILLVDWEGPDDPMCARNWSVSKRALATAQISLIGFAVGATSGIDATIIPQAAKEFGVSQVVESVAIGVYLIGIGTGSLVAGPFSETFGRNAVYVVSMIVFMCWILGTALAPNIAAQIVFRFLAGCSSSTPMVCSGGSVADMWNSLEKTWSFPYYTTLSFVGPMVGSIMGAYIGPSSHTLSWRWAEWVILILSGLVLISVVVTMPETYGPLILEWKAAHYRRITGDSRFRSEHEIEDSTLFSRLRVSMTRPFLMITEPIIIAMTMYLSVLYIVLFTFLVGWPYIFERTYGIDQGLAHIIFISMMIGTVSPALLVPFVYRKTAKVIKQAQSQAEGGNKNARFHPEIRLWYGMLGPAVAVPVSLFWMGWTSYSHISIWSPIIASAFFGFGVTGIFICAYMYIIDSYESYSASALTFVALTRYVIAGGMTVVGIPFYEKMGTHYTLTIMGSISVLLMPIPYLLYFFGHRLREKIVQVYHIQPRFTGWRPLVACCGEVPDKYRSKFSSETQKALSYSPSDWPEVEFIPLNAYISDWMFPLLQQPFDGKKYTSLTGPLVAPLSRGNITLQSADTSDYPLINPNFLGDKSDQEVAVALYRRLREVARADVLKTVVGAEAYPGAEYQTDEEILSVLRSGMMTVWHAACTCKMGKPTDKMAVIYSKARVFGVKGLRVVDASAFPVLIPGHPQGTLCARAEMIAYEIINGN